MNRSDFSSARIQRVILRVCGLPAALVTWAIWSAIFIGSLGSHAWVFDLFTNFRVQYMALFALCVIALTIGRWRKTAVVALLGVAYTTGTAAMYFQERVVEPPSNNGFRLVTFNIWFRNEDLVSTARFLQDSGADILILQEVDRDRVDELAQLLPAYRYRATTPDVRRVLAIFSRWPIDAEHLELPNRVARMTRVNVDWRGTNVAVFGAHLSWPLGQTNARARAAELRALAVRARRETGPVLVAGDFNLTPWSGYFTRFIEESGLTDCAIGQGLLPTWPAQVLPARIRIDVCFASSHWRVHQVRVGPKLGSDHLPVIADMQLLTRE